MKSKIIFCLLSVCVVLLVVSGCAKGPGPDNNNPSPSDNDSSLGGYDLFAQCLTEKGVKMYGTEWCSHCKNQKKMFGDSFQHVDYIDCDLNKDECQEAGIGGYPTWIIGGEKYPGEQSFERLASLTECELV